MRFKEFHPPENLCNIEVGKLFRAEEDGKLYLLVHRDAIRCVVLEWTWWRQFRSDLRAFFRGEKANNGKANDNGRSKS